jgi:oligopeptide/dipeptide ABC transporter ATP-binding protein
MGRVLEIASLSAEIRRPRSTVRVVSHVDLHLQPGETLGLVGESGCGKSMTGLSVMQLLPPGGRVVTGSVRVAGRELVGLSPAEMRKVRGNDVAMIFQDSLTSLNPVMPVGEQVAEPLRRHRGLTRKQAVDRAAELLGMVGIPSSHERLNSYPHQLSGGLRQRVMIAVALSCDPKVLIADEPTTALDVTMQAQILALLGRLKAEFGMAMMLITHDMGVVANNADRVSVIYAGRVVEVAGTRTLFSDMRHPYTQALLASIPRLGRSGLRSLHSIPGRPPDLTNPPPGCRFAPRCRYATQKCWTQEPPLMGETPGHLFACWHPVEGPQPQDAALTVRARTGGLKEQPNAAATAQAAASRPAEPLIEVTDLVKEFPLTRGSVLQRTVGMIKAVSDVSLSVGAREIFGLVGESGCGKTTLGRMIVALDAPDSGSVCMGGAEISRLTGRALRRRRRDLQMMFQDPYSSLDPRMRVGAILREPLVIQKAGDARAQEGRIRNLLDEVGLSRSALDRFPHEFSSGQRQRIGLARALALNPALIVADEPVSALDVSVRSQVLNLMKELQEAHGLSYLVISHDFTVVSYLSNRIGVMYLGKLVEVGPSSEVCAHPAHPYTAGLISAILEPDPRTRRKKPGGGIHGELPSPVSPPSGCRFRTRCPRARERCAQEEPVLRSFGPGHVAACHFPLRPDGEKAAVGG